MPPPDAEFPAEEAGTDLASIEIQIETNITEIAHFKSQQRNFVQRVHKEQHDFAQKLEDLHESQQDLLKKLSIIKSENQIQEINNLKAEKQLFRSDLDVFSSSAATAPDETPTPSSKTFDAGSSTNNKRKADVVDDNEDIKLHPGKLARSSRVSGSNPAIKMTPDPSKKDLANLAVDMSTRTRDVTAGPSKKGDTSIKGRDLSPRPDAQVSDGITVYLNRKEHLLELSEEEGEETFRAWKQEGGKLRDEWKKQLKDFDKKNQDWPNKARTAGCVRSAIFNSGKCYLTTEDEGEYACKTCWNTNHFCVAWDDEDKYFWIRPQLPAVRSKKTVGPFDLERFRSMKDGPTRQKLPPYWQDSFTP